MQQLTVEPDLRALSKSWDSGLDMFGAVPFALPILEVRTVRCTCAGDAYIVVFMIVMQLFLHEYTSVEPPDKGHIGTISVVPYREGVLIGRVSL